MDANQQRRQHREGQRHQARRAHTRAEDRRAAEEWSGPQPKTNGCSRKRVGRPRRSPGTTLRGAVSWPKKDRHIREELRQTAEDMRQVAEDFRRQTEAQLKLVAETLHQVTQTQADLHTEMRHVTRKLMQLEQWFISLGHRLNTLEDKP